MRANSALPVCCSPFTDALIDTRSCDPECAALADRHYSRQTIGSPQFVGNGRKQVLRNTNGTVVFAWLWSDPAYRLDHQLGYNCTIFRNESARRSSDLILEAEQWAIQKWGPNRAYTYVDPGKIRSVNPGYCFKQAGWTFVKVTASGKHLLEKWLI